MACDLGDSSALILTSLIGRPIRRPDARAEGLTVRHGPHQGAQKSTSTGMIDAVTTSANDSSPGFGYPRERSTCISRTWAGLRQTTGTRFFVPQVSHRTTVESDDSCRRLPSTRRLIDGHGQAFIAVVEPDLAALKGICSQECPGHLGLDLMGDEPPQGPSPVDRVESLLGYVVPGILG